MLLANVVQTSKLISETTKRLEKSSLLAHLLKQLQPEEAAAAVGFLSGAPRQGRIGIGYAALQNAAASAAEIATLPLLEADRILDQISTVQGAGSEQRKRELLRELFGRATHEEQRFLIALLGGELRQGALEGIMLEALANASGVSVSHIRRAAMMAGDAKASGSVAIARAVLENGDAGLAPYDLQLFRPVQPMLAGTAEDTSDALASLGEAALEYKLDGARIQVHKAADQVIVFSRGANDVTAAVPEVVEAARALPAHDLILDGEVLSLMPDGRPRPFQISMRRFGRKLDVNRLREELPMTPFWFDLLYLEGHSLVDQSQQKRFKELARLTPPDNLIPNLVTGDSQRAEDFLHQALQRGHEGVMAKDQSSGYAAGSRGQSWLKIKQARTLDLVILAAEWGNGRRKGWLSNLHLGARDTEKGGFAMLGKTFKGLTDEMLVWQTQELLKLEVARDNYTVYVLPKLVVEVAFNEVQASSRYVSGLALRFARVKRYRTDKGATDCDTFQTVQKLVVQ